MVVTRLGKGICILTHTDHPLHIHYYVRPLPSFLQRNTDTDTHAHGNSTNHITSQAYMTSNRRHRRRLRSVGFAHIFINRLSVSQVRAVSCVTIKRVLWMQRVTTYHPHHHQHHHCTYVLLVRDVCRRRRRRRWRSLPIELRKFTQ